MALETLLLFLITDLAFCLTPGPATAVTMAHAMRPGDAGGIKGALGPIVGINIGNFIWYAATGLGLIALINTSPRLYTIIQWAGVAYLIYQGWRMIRSATEQSVGNNPMADAGPPKGQFISGFASGFAVHMSNPKALIFYAAFLPQFIEPTQPLGQQIFILAIITIFTETTGLGFYTILASKLRNFTKVGALQRLMPQISGAILILVAVILFIANIQYQTI